MAWIVAISVMVVPTLLVLPCSSAAATTDDPGRGDIAVRSTHTSPTMTTRIIAGGNETLSFDHIIESFLTTEEEEECRCHKDYSARANNNSRNGTGTKALVTGGGSSGRSCTR